MSRIGKKPVAIPAGVKVAVNGSAIHVEGAKGKLDFTMPAGFKAEVKDTAFTVVRPTDTKVDRSKHGLIRALVNNMIIGVTKGYQKDLEISGVGFKAQVTGKVLNIVLSYTHPINFTIPNGITIETPKPTSIVIKGPDKAMVGQAAAEIRSYYKPEPYKGKGIKYAGEIVRRKAGKAVAGAAGGGAGK